ncbi:MAG: zinc ABC transporter substrate-binding protein [Chloroflexota bacterium]
MKRAFLLLILFMLVVAPAAGNAQDDQLQIVASFTILEDVVRNVTGDAANVSTLMPVGADPHTFEPTPRDITAVADADVVFTNGAFFEEGLLEAIENADTEMNIVEVSACVNIIAFGAGHGHGDEDHAEGEEHGDEDHADGEAVAMAEGMSAIAEMCAAHEAQFEAIHEMREEEHEEGEEHGDEDHAHEHGGEAMGALYTLECGEGHGHGEEEHEEGEEHGDDDHEEGEEHSDEDHAHEHGEGSCDPHVWMQPHNVMRWTMVIRDTLVELDPANAETYATNADAYLLELDALMHDFVMPAVETVPEENRILVTNHESMGYFANRFEFEVVTTVLPGGTAVEPSVAEVAQIIDTINEEGVPAIFAETTVSDDIAEQIAAETGAELFVLFSGSLSDADGPATTYVDYITYNVTTIVEALGGSVQ